MAVSRRQVREKVLQAIYAYEFSKDPIEKIKSELLTEITDKENRNFADGLIKQVIENKKEHEKLIKSAVENWDMERIAAIDLIIIRMCLSEFLFFEDIPPKVSINEAIDLAKAYSTKNSGKFVNGVLDGLLASLSVDGHIKKKGKGLLESSKKKSDD